MNREELYSLVMPLNSREKRYRDDPKSRADFSRLVEGHNTAADAIPQLDFTPGDTLFDSGKRHGLFYDNEHISPEVQSLSVVINKMSRFSVVPVHRRRYIEIKFVYNGNATAILAGKEVPLTRGDVILLDYDSAHSILPLGTRDVVFNFMMRPALFRERFLAMLSASGAIGNFLAQTMAQETGHDRCLLVRTGDDATLRELVENAVCTYLDPGLSPGVVIMNYLQLFFIRLAECYQAEKERAYKEEGKNYITEILGWVEKNARTCTLAETSAHFGYSTDHLSRIIRKSTGMSFKEFVIHKKLEYASYQLLYSAASVADIASDCGFSNLNFFYRKFELARGCTPAEYRKKGQEGNFYERTH